MHWDVIIGGAGPAGTTAALFLNKIGYNVLLIDKQEFPRTKICGDAIAPASIDILNKLNLIKKYKQLHKHTIQRFKIFSPGGYVWDSSFKPKPGFEIMSIMKRCKFDHFLLEEARARGVHFNKAKIVGLNRDAGQFASLIVIENNKTVEYKAKIIIGADGVHSTIANLLKAPIAKNCQQMIAMRAYTRDVEIESGCVEGYFYKNILPGYIWIFPMDEQVANIGLGMRLDYFRRQNKNLKTILNDFVHSPVMKDRIKHPVQWEELGGHLLKSTFNNKNSRVFKRALLIGDAGGWVDPLTGGGIANTMVSAEIAAETIHQSIQKGDFSVQALMDYEKNCKLILGKELRRNGILQKLLVMLPYPFLDTFIRFANNSKLVEKILSNMYNDIDFRPDESIQ